MMSFLQKEWLSVTTTLLMGIVLGFLIINPILRWFEKKMAKENRLYWSQFLKMLMKISPVFSAILLLNLLYFFNVITINPQLKSTFNTIVKIFNSIVFIYLSAEILVLIYDKYSNRKADSKASSLFHIVIRILIYTSGVFVISNILNYDIKALLTAMGVGGLAIALALQDTLGNLFSGMQILASKQLKPGDYIKIEDKVEGYVLDVNWRNTTIKTLLENVIIVPNSKISSTITTNYFTLQKNLYFQIPIGVHYDSDLEQVEKITLAVAQEVLSQYPNVPKDFEPRVRFYEFADSSINFKVWMATDLYENQYVIKHHFIKSLHEKYNQEDIVIPFPIRTLYLQKETLNRN